jgi:uncharacterized protein (DUF1501 family)
MALTRREFLCRSFGAFGAALAFERFGLLQALAQTTGDYKALVCIFLFGGNDAGNMIIPYDDYDATYLPVRQGTGLAIPKSSLLPISVPSIGSQFALHPSLTGLQQLWGPGNVAVVCNVGPLVEPTNRDSYINGTAHLPLNLFSHSDQQNQWQTSISDGTGSSGWGGRTADKTAQLNSSVLPVVLSVAGTPIFVTGQTETALALATAPTALNAALGLDGFPNPPDSDFRYHEMVDILQLDQDITLVRGASRVTMNALNAAATLRQTGNPAVPPFPLNPRTSLGNQLEQVAKLISVRDSLGMSRQIFFCSLGGFDTHFNQVLNNANPTAGTQANLLTQVGDAMKAFYDATVALGVASQVVTFTLSDFSRTFVPNGNLGTDHGWGSHHFVMGGSVIGGDFYGVPGSNGTVFPTLAPAGPDDTDQGSSARGRWIPTTAVDQYGASLATWFGVGNTDLAAVFPNIGSFGQSNLGFLR